MKIYFKIFSKPLHAIKISAATMERLYIIKTDALILLDLVDLISVI